MKRKHKKVENFFLQSIIDTFIEFAENSSIHGLKYTVKKKLNVVERLLWICVILSGVCGSIFMLRLFWNRFTSNPTRTSIETNYAPTIAIEFPGVTICNINPILNSKVDEFVKNLNLQNQSEEYVRNIFSQLRAYSDDANYNSSDLETLQKLFDFNEYGSFENVMGKLGQRCRDMLLKCKWEAKIINCLDYFVDIYTKRGVCCSFNYNSLDKHIMTTYFYGFQMGLSVLLNPMVENAQRSSLHSEGMRVLIHHPSSQIGFGSSQKIVATGRETLMQLSGTRYKCTEEVRQLNPNDRKCVYSDEHSLKYFSEYSDSNCKSEQDADHIESTCGCVPYYYKFKGEFVSIAYGNKPIKILWTTPEHSSFNEDNLIAAPFSDETQKCTLLWFNRFQFFLEKPVCNVTKIPCLRSVKELEVTALECPPLCEDVFYNVLSTSTRFVNSNISTSSFINKVKLTDKTILLRVFFSGRAQTVLLRDTLTSTIYLFSSFGGIFSLFLGCSFISVAEIIYYVTIRFLFNYQQLKRAQMKVNMVKPVNFDLKRYTHKTHNVQAHDGTVVYTIYDKNMFLN